MDADYLVLEARTGPGGQWKPVEAFPQTFCGNSFHRVFLEPGEYWDLSARRYSGSLKTKLRFRLEPGGEQAVTEGGQPIYSEEFDGSVSPGQFLARRNQWDE